MLRKTSIRSTILAALLTLFLATPQALPASQSGQTRTYYIAADEINWDYAPSGTDQIHGEKYHFQDDPASKGMLNPNATVYRKAIFREYTDASFKTASRVPRHGHTLASWARSFAPKSETRSNWFSKTMHHVPAAFIPTVSSTARIPRARAIRTTPAAGTKPTTPSLRAPPTPMSGRFPSEPDRQKARAAPRSGSITRM